MLKTICTLLIVVGLMAWPALGFQDATAWITFNSREGKFTVQLPVEPKVQVQEVDSAVGKLTMYSYSASTNAAYLMVSYGDYPKEANDAAHAERVLDGVIGGVLKSLGGEKTSENKITVKGRANSEAPLLDHPGREFVAKKMRDGDEVIVKWKIALVGRRLYQLAAITYKDKANSPDIAKFLTSFRLTD